MGRYFWDGSIGPFLRGQRDVVQGGYRSVAFTAAEMAAECAEMLRRFEERIALRSLNALSLTSDPEYGADDEAFQAELDVYYRSEADKLRWLIRSLESIKELAENPARDPQNSPIKVVSIR